MWVQFRRFLKFSSSFFLCAFLSQSQAELVMGGCEVWHRAYRSTELRYCTVEVPDAQQPAPRVGSESGCLLVGLLLTGFGPGFAFGGCTSGITELAKNRSQRSVGTGEIWLQANCLVQSIGGIGQLIHLLQDCT